MNYKSFSLVIFLLVPYFLFAQDAVLGSGVTWASSKANIKEAPFLKNYFLAEETDSTIKFRKTYDTYEMTVFFKFEGARFVFGSQSINTRKWETRDCLLMFYQFCEGYINSVGCPIKYQTVESGGFAEWETNESKVSVMLTPEQYPKKLDLALIALWNRK